MRGPKRLVTFLSIFALLIVNFVTVGMLTSSAYEVKSGPQPSGAVDNQATTSNGQSTSAPAVVVPKTSGSGSVGTSVAVSQGTKATNSRDGSDYKGFAIIDGYKFEDLNGNGVRDAGEPGMAGVKFTCTGFFLWQIVHETVTDENGYFRFPWCMATTWTVAELGVDGYYNTTPKSVSVTVTWLEHKSVNFGNARYATIKAVKFFDDDKNGIMASTEAGAAGVTIELTGNGIDPVSLTTGSDGLVVFPNLEAGTYKVRVTSDLDGYYLTTPASFDVTVLPGATETVYFGNAKDVPPPPATIKAVKFFDDDKNGIMASTEAGAAGVTIELTGNGIDPVSLTTGSDGLVVFPNLEAGTYKVRVTSDLDGYYLTTPASFDVTVEPGDDKTVYFGNALDEIPPGTIDGYKFLDSDGNGVVGDLEPGMAGITVRLTGNNVYLETTTGANGYFSFPDLTPGTYLVELVNDPAGYYLTTPGSFDVTVASEATETVYFGNAPYAEIFGYKWNDLNANGSYDDGEPPLANVTIQLNVLKSTTTNGDGYYEFTNLTAGAYEVSEVVPEGYTPTSPAKVELTLEPGDSREVDFLNTSLLGSISGTKWFDSDGNGLVGEGEKGLEGVTIQLWVGLDLIDTMVSGADGTYTFVNLAAGDYIVMEVVPQSFYPTSTTSRPVSLTTGEDKTGIDFLNAPYATISGNKWDDPDQDGVHSSSEAPVPGVTVTLSRAGMVDITAITDASGKYNFGKLEAGAYTVTETLPTGSKNTSPLSVTVVLKPGDNVSVDFLNVTVGGEIIVPPVNPTSGSTSGDTLPYTGMNQFAWYVAAALIMLLGLFSTLLGIFRNRAVAG